MGEYELLSKIKSPHDVKKLNIPPVLPGNRCSRCFSL